MALKHPDARLWPSNGSRGPDRSSHSKATTFPRHELRETELPPEVAYQIIHDELMLDGNARMNLATFVSTWMEPQAERLMAECLDKNMIDKDEYPQTAELEMRCVNILSRLWHAPDASEAVGCSTTGSSEAAMLGGLALKRRWQTRRRADGASNRQAQPRHGDQRPGLLGEVRELLGRRDAPRPHGRRPLPPLGRRGREAVRREHDRGRRDPGLDVRRILRTGRRRSARRSTGFSSEQGSTSLSTSTARQARSSHRSSTPTSPGTSSSHASRRSTPPDTSTASSTPASAGSSGGTRPLSLTT